VPQPVWRKVVPDLPVPKDNTKQWTLALEFLTAGKIIKIEAAGEWTPTGFTAPCTADGDLSGAARGAFTPPGNPLVASAPIGALIARIGGSTADTGPDTPPTSSPPTVPARIVLSVGRECVFTVPNAPTGSLFLGINDDPTRMLGITGSQTVNIYEAL
jgi:hypothetical protein